MKTDEFEGYTLSLKEPIRRWSGGAQHQHVSGDVLIVREAEELRLYIKNKPTWTGEGLPPVGTVCEIRAHKLNDWSRATIKFAERNVIVWDWEDEPALNGLCTAYAHAIEIRPIRTPEQIAAEEREAAIKEAMPIIRDACAFPQDMGRANIASAVVHAMIDAGYRKQVKP